MGAKTIGFVSFHYACLNQIINEQAAFGYIDELVKALKRLRVSIDYCEGQYIRMQVATNYDIIMKEN